MLSILHKIILSAYKLCSCTVSMIVGSHSASFLLQKGTKVKTAADILKVLSKQISQQDPFDSETIFSAISTITTFSKTTE